MSSKNNTGSLYFLMEYAVWFLIFMLIESFVNTRVGEILGNENVELLYAVFILFTAFGFIIFGCVGRRIINSKKLSVCLILICILSFGMFSVVNISVIVMFGAALSLLVIGFMGGKIMYSISNNYHTDKLNGTALGFAMGAAILAQFIIQNMISSRITIIVCYEMLLLILLIFELFTAQQSIDIVAGNALVDGNNIWIYVVATVLMTIILSLNDAFLVDLSAHTSTVRLFGFVRLFYCISLVLAGVIYDYRNSFYFNIFVACAMMLSTVAYAFMGNTTDYNINMSVMYSYCGFYVMFLTIHFIRISNMMENVAERCLIPSLGRVARCITTSAVTFIIILMGNLISVQTMIVVSCVLSMVLVVLLATNDILIIKEQNKIINDSLVLNEPTISFPHQETIWNLFVEKYGFTNRESEVLEKLINTEKNLQEISDELFISKRVVQRHITSIYEKTNRTTRIGLLQLYVEFFNNN